MEVLVLDQRQVRALLPMSECIDAVAGALGALARGEAIQPLRPIMWLPERVGALGMMPGYLSDRDVMGIKVISVFPGNEGTELDSHQGVVMLFETERGRPLAIVDATEVTAIRTAAASAVATDALALTDAGVLAVLGSGTQARSHLEAMAEVRPLRSIRVWSRHRDNAVRLVGDVGDRLGVPIDVSASAEAAVRGADIVCTTTASATPVLQGEWLDPGCHVNAVGSSVPFARELDAEAVRRSVLFVDRRESTLAEAGDFLLAREEGLVDDGHIAAEIGEVLTGTHPGRTSPEEITLFESTGLAVEDVAAVDHLYRRAVQEGAGTWIELGGERARG